MAYSGADAVTTFDAAQLVGVWNITPLNPLEGEGNVKAIIEYRADGTLLGQSEPTGQGTAALGELKFETTGNWAIDGELVAHSNLEIKEVTGNKLAGVLGSIIRNASRNVAAQANIYELTSDRMVMVGTTDGQAMAYDRIR